MENKKIYLITVSAMNGASVKVREFDLVKETPKKFKYLNRLDEVKQVSKDKIDVISEDGIYRQFHIRYWTLDENKISDGKRLLLDEMDKIWKVEFEKVENTRNRLAKLREEI